MSRLHAIDRPDIKMPDGRVFAPVDKLAAEWNLHPRTLKRKAPVTYVANCAYVDRDVAALALIGESKQRNSRRAR